MADRMGTPYLQKVLNQVLSTAAHYVTRMARLAIRALLRWKDAGKAKTCGQQTSKYLKLFCCSETCEDWLTLPSLHHKRYFGARSYEMGLTILIVKHIKADNGGYTPKAEHCFILSVTLVQNQ